VERIIASAPSLELLPPQQRLAGTGLDDEELAQPTIFPFVIRQAGRALALADCRKIYRALARDARDAAGDPEIAARLCLIGQPVALGRGSQNPVAALRISASARLVTQTWSADEDAARRNLQRQLADVDAIVAKIEWLLAHIDDLNSMEACRGA
jgi:hypothetical protein